MTKLTVIPQIMMGHNSQDKLYVEDLSVAFLLWVDSIPFIGGLAMWDTSILTAREGRRERKGFERPHLGFRLGKKSATSDICIPWFNAHIFLWSYNYSIHPNGKSKLDESQIGFDARSPPTKQDHKWTVYDLLLHEEFWSYHPSCNSAIGCFPCEKKKIIIGIASLVLLLERNRSVVAC